LAGHYCLAEFADAIQTFYEEGLDCIRNRRLIWEDLTSEEEEKE
jgi:hypothetical protein